MALYLFLTLAADRDGRSFYSDRSIEEILKMSPSDLAEARTELVEAGLVDYRRPYFWVKTLSTPQPRSRSVAKSPVICRPATEPEPVRGIVPAGLRLLIESLEENR